MRPMGAFEWIKNDPDKYNWFTDGSKFLVALQIRDQKKKITYWDYDVVVTSCDGEGMHLCCSNGEVYDAWTWPDFEYFVLLDGEMPAAGPGDEK